MTPAEILNDIQGITQSQTAAIHKLADGAPATFQQAESAMSARAHKQWHKADRQRFNDHHLALLDQYMCVSAFISAWYDVNNDKQQAEKARRSCATLVAGVGFNRKQILRQYLGLERLWRKALTGASYSSPLKTALAAGIAATVLITAVVYWTTG